MKLGIVASTSNAPMARNRSKFYLIFSLDSAHALCYNEIERCSIWGAYG